MADDRRQQVTDELIAVLRARGYRFMEPESPLVLDLLPLIDRVAAEAAAEALGLAAVLVDRAAQLRAAPTVTETQETTDGR